LHTDPVGIQTGSVQAAAPAPRQYTDLWERIRAGFALPPIHNATVERYEKWYAERPEYVAAMTQRAGRYLYYIVERVEARGMPTEIALLPAIESAYKPRAYSRARAAGLWQFIPSTGRLYGLKQNWWYDGRRDVVEATDAALDYLEKLHEQFNGDWHLALAAYNAGERRIERSIQRNERNGKDTDYLSLHSLKRETRHYVPKLMAVVNIVRDPAHYGLKLTSIPNRPYFDVAEIDGQVDLGVVADVSGVSVRELHSLNAGFRRWATDPQGPHRLLVPHGDRESITTALANLPASKRVQYGHYSVRRGDTLGGIARRHGLSVAALRSTNKIRGSLIRAGQDLLIPLSSRRITSARLARATASASGTAASSNGKRQLVHRVRAGDTLYAIARRYNVYVHQIASWNNLKVNSVLRLGQKLKIVR
jgi:membrane-bound lytic murein transglycosylase D